MTGYTKLFGTIIASTIWRETNEVRIVWITMLAMANKDGVVEASIPGLADMARVSIDECKKALVALESPDEYSRTPDHEGRRIAKVESGGGWNILNHAKYRAKMGVDERREYLRQKQAEGRAKKKASTIVNNGQQSSTMSAHTEAKEDTKEEAEAKPIKSKAGIPTTETAKRIATLFSRRLTTAWSEKEIQAFKKLGVIELEDLALIEKYYEAERAKGEKGFYRRDVGTFLNNYVGEVDRAVAWSKAPAPVPVDKYGKPVPAAPKKDFRTPYERECDEKGIKRKPSAHEIPKP